MMDKAARKKARELCEKATPGPWVSEYEVTGRVPDAGCGIVASDEDTKISNPSRGIVAWACRLVSRTCAETKANATFIAAARTLLPQALDALDAADSENARLQARVSELEAALAKSENILARNLGHQTEKCYDALAIIRAAIGTPAPLVGDR
jgi:ribosomal protein S20